MIAKLIISKSRWRAISVNVLFIIKYCGSKIWILWTDFIWSSQLWFMAQDIHWNKTGFREKLKVCNILKLHWSFRVTFFSHITKKKSHILKHDLKGRRRKSEVYKITRNSNCDVTQKVLHNNLGYQTFSWDKWFQIRELSSIALGFWIKAEQICGQADQDS